MKLGAFLVGAVLLAMAPGALAVHGEAYDAYGTAVLGTAVYLAEVHWTGYCFSGCSVPPFEFIVRIKDLGGSVVASETFGGWWSANGVPAPGGTELLAYQGWAGDASTQDRSHFYVMGVQWQQVALGGPDKAVMLYVGNYYAYQLQLVVPYTAPWPL